MAWSFAGVEEETITAGEWERIYLLVNVAGLPHAEVDVDPAHCPTCRNAHAIVCLAREGDWDDAVASVSAFPAHLLVEQFLPVDED